MDGYPLGLGLAVEDKPNKFSFTSTSTTKNDLSIRTSQSYFSIILNILQNFQFFYLTCVLPQQCANLAHDRSWWVDGHSHLKQCLLLLKDVVVHVEQSEGSLRDELRVVRGELGQEVVQIERPHLQVSVVGVGTKGTL